MTSLKVTRDHFNNTMTLKVVLLKEKRTKHRSYRTGKNCDEKSLSTCKLAFSDRPTSQEIADFY